MNRESNIDGHLIAGVSILSAVVEGGSFARAAPALGISPSGVSRAIARLEARLGVRLFDRTTRSLRLTDDGHRLYAEVRPLLGGLIDALTTTAGASAIVHGRLRVNVDPFFSKLLLAPAIGRFLARHPQVSLELHSRDQLGELVSEGFDVAIRFGEPAVCSLVARRLLTTRIMTVASPAYLKKHGRPKTPAALADHACIQFRDARTGQPFAWEFRRGRKVIPVPTTGRLLLTDVDTMLGACLAGVGIAQVLGLSVRELIERGRLIELFANWPDETYPLYAYYPSRNLPSAKLRAFMDFVLELTR